MVWLPSVREIKLSLKPLGRGALVGHLWLMEKATLIYVMSIT